MNARASLLGAVALLAAACGGTQLQNTEARLGLDRDAFDFGQRPVLDDLSIPLTLSNLGRGPLELTLRIEGDDAFTLVGALTQLEGGAEETLAVNFKATEQKSYAGKLIIETNETDGSSPHVLPLVGVGSTVAAAQIDPPSLDFGRVGEGRTSVKRVRVTSVGTADLKVKTIQFKGGSSAAYAFVGSTRTPQTLAARVEGRDDAFAEITVKFAPTAAITDTAGTLVIETTDPAHALVEVPLVAAMNRQPIAEPGADRPVAPGSLVQLDGSASTDPDGDLPLTFKWTLSTKPQGSAAQLVGDTTATPSLQLDQPGGYAIDLVVTDSAGLQSKPKRVTITGVAAEKLLIQLVWDHPVADLDLHVLRPGDQLDADFDCSWQHPHPDWGTLGDPNDDPAHLGDKLAGFGPESVVYEQPIDGDYRIAVAYNSAQGSASPALNATVRIYMYGVVVRELTHPMAAAGELWEAGTVNWPTGDVSPTTGVTP